MQKVPVVHFNEVFARTQLYVITVYLLVKHHAEFKLSAALLKYCSHTFN